MYLLCFFAIIGSFGYAGLHNPPASAFTWYLVVPEACSIFGLMWLFSGIFNCVLAPAHMEIRDYRGSSLRIISASGLCAVLLSAVFLLSLVYFAANRQRYGLASADILPSFGFLASGILSFFLRLAECSIDWVQESKDNRPGLRFF